MFTLKIKETTVLFQLIILFVGLLLILMIFYLGRSLNSKFATSNITLESLLVTNNIQN